MDDAGILSVIVAVSAFTTALATVGTVLVSRKVFREQTDPYVVASAFPSEGAHGLFSIQIRNIGRDPAFDLRYVIKSGPTPEGILDNFSKWNGWRDLEMLPGGKSIEIGIGSAHSIVHAPKEYSFNIGVRYLTRRGKVMEDEFRARPSQFGNLAAYPSYQEKLIRAVEDIGEKIKALPRDGA